MKRFVFFLTIFITTFGLRSQVINFEDPGLQEGDIVTTQCIEVDGEECCVTFARGNSDYEPIGSPVIAEVGGQNIPGVGTSATAFYTSQARTAPECGIDTPATHFDMPLPYEGLGCKFLTLNHGEPSDIDDLDVLIIDYVSPTVQASGEIIDIDGNGGNDSEEWTIMAFENTGGQYQLVATEVLNVNSPGAGDGRAAPFSFNLSQPFERIVIEYTGTREEDIDFAFDNFRACSLPPLQNDSCCEGDNIIGNGNFENGMPNIGSDYVSAEDDLLQGTYTIVDPAEDEICSNWNITCGGRYMAINGRTDVQGTDKVIGLEENVDTGAHTFCVDLRRLENCCFDYDAPEVGINIESAKGNITSKSITVDTDPEDGCDWLTTTIAFELEEPSLITIDIFLKRQPGQDGNDLAINNLSLVTMGTGGYHIPLSLNNTTSENGNPNDNFYNITSTTNGVMKNGCDYSWKVCEYDLQQEECIQGTEMTGDQTTGWGDSTNFPGYGGASPGEFEYGNFYQITRLANCPCSGDSQWKSILYSGSGSLLLNHFSNDSEQLDNFVDKIESGKNTSLSIETTEATNNKEDIKLYPNPTDGNYTLEFSDPYTGEADLRVISISGQLIHKVKADFEGGVSNEIGLPRDLADGLYFIEIRKQNSQNPRVIPLRLQR